VTRTGKMAVLVDLCGSSASLPHWAGLGYEQCRIDSQTLQERASEPELLEQRIGAQLAERDLMLIIAADGQPPARVAEIPNWDGVLHEPLARCFTVVRGLVPRIARSPRGGHVIAVLSRSAVFPDAPHGAAAVLGRALLGVFESLRAELRLTSTRVTIHVADDSEDPDIGRARMGGVLQYRPFHSLPAAIDPQSITRYFAPMLEALEYTPRGTPLPAGPQGEVYQVDQLRDVFPRDA